MFTIVIALIPLMAGHQAVVMKSKQTYQTEEACTAQLADGLNYFKGQGDEQFGKDQYLLTGKCFQGMGEKAGLSSGPV